MSINDGVYLNGKGGLKIGNNTTISAGAMIISTGLCTSSFLVENKHIDKEIIIGNNVQIGAGAIILAGVNIADNVIVGAGSVVTKNIQGNVIVAGNPAKVLRELIL
ncbi:acyltransferase [Psychromonas algicola]|uniref:acyltransferase n=1 Tax=Psychromonas algicola TaxID=2555642 RepID=UPI00403EF08F